MENQELIIIKSLEPFSSLSPDRLEEVLKEATVSSYGTGKMVFKRGDNDDASYWLLAGSIDLLDESFNARNLSSRDPDAVHVLDDQNPHVLSGVTTEDSSVLKVRRTVLDDHLNEHEMEEIDAGIDWTSTLLSSPLFEFIPPANIQELFEKFEEVKFQKGDVVVTQGEPGDYFYVIRSGRLIVERANKGKPSVLAELRAGDTFGQDALISDVPRNATVTMTTRGILMRLSEHDFESLLMHPISTERETPADTLVIHADRILRTVTGHLGHAVNSPSESEPEPTLTPEQRKHAAALMRINHCGEVCAQALYEGQALTAHNPETRKVLQQAAAEEQEHLRWCEQRLDELDDRVSRLNPLFYAASLTTGMLTGLLGDRVNLGFVAATEERVVHHLDEHLESLPDSDERSRAILSQMREDEHRHGTHALEQGGVRFPVFLKRAMTLASRLMTRSTYYW